MLHVKSSLLHSLDVKSIFHLVYSQTPPHIPSFISDERVFLVSKVDQVNCWAILPRKPGWLLVEWTNTPSVAGWWWLAALLSLCKWPENLVCSLSFTLDAACRSVAEFRFTWGAVGGFAALDDLRLPVPVPSSIDSCRILAVSLFNISASFFRASWSMSDWRSFVSPYCWDSFRFDAALISVLLPPSASCLYQCFSNWSPYSCSSSTEIYRSKSFKCRNSSSKLFSSATGSPPTFFFFWKIKFSFSAFDDVDYIDICIRFNLTFA